MTKFREWLHEANAIPMKCMECGKKFKKKFGPKTIEVKCPKCKSTDVEEV